MRVTGTWPEEGHHPHSWKWTKPGGKPRPSGEMGPPVLLFHGPLITMTSWRTQAGVHGKGELKALRRGRGGKEGGAVLRGRRGHVREGALCGAEGTEGTQSTLGAVMSLGLLQGVRCRDGGNSLSPCPPLGVTWRGQEGQGPGRLPLPWPLPALSACTVNRVPGVARGAGCARGARGQHGSHGAAHRGRTVGPECGCGHLPAPGGPDAPAPTLGCTLPARPPAIARAGQPAAD
ncbi:Hypothetical predicted protein [Marmota monax]|uniref:Uncharacterized protein n=1 Tax=Marmota monax TaxID=9995 RepID=A0A5E4AJ47_MARMO|nr:Hypothetical predicted protein [Marmota monax]